MNLDFHCGSYYELSPYLVPCSQTDTIIFLRLWLPSHSKYTEIETYMFFPEFVWCPAKFQLALNYKFPALLKSLYQEIPDNDHNEYSFCLWSYRPGVTFTTHTCNCYYFKVIFSDFGWRKWFGGEMWNTRNLKKKDWHLLIWAAILVKNKWNRL